MIGAAEEAGWLPTPEELEEPTAAELAEQALDLAEQVMRSAARSLGTATRVGTDGPQAVGMGLQIHALLELAEDLVAWATDDDEEDEEDEAEDGKGGGHGA